MVLKKIVIFLLCFSCCFSAPYNNSIDSFENQNYNTEYNNQNYVPYAPFENLDNSVVFIGGVYGFGLENSRKNYAGAHFMIKLSQRTFLNIEALQIKAKLQGNLSHKNNILTGKNISYMSNMMFGVRLKPFESFAISPYIGMGASVLYVDYLAASTFTSGIDMVYVASSYLSVSVGYKNIFVLFFPTPDVEHYVNTGLEITF